MTNNANLCPHCGARCKPGDGICSSCWKKLPTAAAAQEGVIDGYNRSDWVAFVGKNAQRYVPLFEKHEGQRFFLHMNWAAFFFGIAWMFYRRMYKFGAIACAIAFLVSMVTTAALILPHREEMEQLGASITAYEQYKEHGGDTVLEREDGTRYSPPVVKEGLEAQRRLNDLEWNFYLVTLLVSLAVDSLVMGLCADAIYKRHVWRNITEPHRGGASIGHYLVGMLVYNLVEAVILSPMLNLFTLLLLN